MPAITTNANHPVIDIANLSQNEKEDQTNAEKHGRIQYENDSKTEQLEIEIRIEVILKIHACQIGLLAH